MNNVDFNHLFQTHTSDNEPVAYDQNNIYDWADFKAQVTAWSAVFRAEPFKNYLLFAENTYAFAIGFFALAFAGKRIILPPNVQPGTLQENASLFEACVVEAELPVERHKKSHFISNKIPAITASLPRLNAEDVVILVMTSGSTGEAKVIEKHLGHFEAELQVLETLWGETLGRCRIESTVSHQHIYGLLFRCLWPIACGRPFSVNQLDYPEILIERLVEAGNQCKQPAESRGFALVSSPAFIKRFDQSLQAPASEALKAVFSSGGPLPPSDNLRFQQQVRVAVIEVLGSSETGGVGYRQLTAETATPHLNWHGFPNVELRANEHQILEVKSPQTFCNGWYSMGDRVELLSDHQFLLKGRSDRILKLEEKRLSLDELERRLDECLWVKEAKAVVLDGSRQQLGVIAELSEAGRELLQHQGKLKLNETLKTMLLTHFERVVLPRKWRYVDKLPYNSQGKLPLQVLTALFTEQKNPVTLPQVVDKKVLDETVRITLHIPEDLLYFDGHFEQAKLLAGVVQIDWAVHFGQQLFNIVGEFVRLEVVKFQQVISPGAEVYLDLQCNQPLSNQGNSNQEKYSQTEPGQAQQTLEKLTESQLSQTQKMRDNAEPTTTKLVFKYWSEGHSFSSGRVVFSK